MHFRIIALLALAYATACTAISVLLPLYLYPSPGAWQPVYDVLNNASYKSINFYIVVNVNSGPNCASCTYPQDTNYQAAIGALNSLTGLNKYRNVYTLGYVSTSFTNRAYKSVVADIYTYSLWSTTPNNLNVSMAGIFFDEMNNSPTTVPLAYYRNASAYAYATVPSDITPVVFNPGTPTNAQFFNYADFIVECENYYSSYQNLTTIKTFTAGYNNQAAILLHNTTSTTNLQSYVHTMIKQSIGAVYVCTDGFYTDLSLLKPLVAAIYKG